MEAVDEFKFVLDIADRDELHDYATQTRLRKQKSEDWSADQFKHLGKKDHIPEDDENKIMMVELMDDAIMDKRFLERKKKDSEENSDQEKKNYHIFNDSLDDIAERNLPSRVLPVYKQGDPVAGELVLKLNKELPAEKLNINFNGQATVNMRIYHRYGYYDASEQEKFVDEDISVWKKAEGNDMNSPLGNINDNIQLLSVSSEPATSSVLNCGLHKFRFEFTVPQDAPQSVPPLLPSTTNYAYLMYRLKATIDKGKHFGRGSIVTHKGMWIKREVDIASEKSNLEPVASENTLDTGVFKSGKVVVRASLPRAGFVKGDTIPLSLEIENQSKSEIVSVSARIKMGGKAKVGFSRMACSHTIKVKSKKICDGPIGVGLNPTYNWQLPWDFKDSSVDGSLLPVGHMDDSKLIDIKYHVVIKVKRHKLHRNLELQVPIEIGNKNSSGTGSTLYPNLFENM